MTLASRSARFPQATAAWTRRQLPEAVGYRTSPMLSADVNPDGNRRPDSGDGLHLARAAEALAASAHAGEPLAVRLRRHVETGSIIDHVQTQRRSIDPQIDVDAQAARMTGDV